jgi:hypothetical protein
MCSNGTPMNEKAHTHMQLSELERMKGINKRETKEKGTARL